MVLIRRTVWGCTITEKKENSVTGLTAPVRCEYTIARADTWRCWPSPETLPWRQLADSAVPTQTTQSPSSVPHPMSPRYALLTWLTGSTPLEAERPVASMQGAQSCPCSLTPLGFDGQELSAYSKALWESRGQERVLPPA